MNITATGLFFAVITGLLGAWVFLSMSDTQHKDYRVNEARVACDKARFDTEFGGRKRKDLQEREARICAEFDAQSGERATQEAQAQKERNELKQSIEKAVATKDDEASKTELAVREAASAVQKTATAIAK